MPHGLWDIYSYSGLSVFQAKRSFSSGTNLKPFITFLDNHCSHNVALTIATVCALYVAFKAWVLKLGTATPNGVASCLRLGRKDRLGSLGSRSQNAIKAKFIIPY